MSHGTENIEAQLCAYVDGELDAKDRVEIEKHLEANPQHRQLLLELMKTRDMLKGLPKVSAPSDMNEALQAQLERSMLLDMKGDSAVIARINHWPQTLAWAAVFVLALGLGAVVYISLPNAKPTVIATAPPLSPVGDAVVADAQPTPPILASGAKKIVTPADEIASHQPAEVVASVKTETSGTPLAMATPPVSSVTNPDSSIAPTATMVSNAASPSAIVIASASASVGGKDVVEKEKAVLNAQTQLNNSVASDVSEKPNTVYVVVATDDPNVAASQVADYFRSRQIAWQNLPESSAIASAAGGSAASVHEELHLVTPSAVTASPMTLEQDRRAAEKLPTTQEGMLSMTATPSTHPSEGQISRANFADNNLIVARNVTRKQAVELTNSLNSPEQTQFKQSVAVYDAPQANTARQVNATSLVGKELLIGGQTSTGHRQTNILEQVEVTTQPAASAENKKSDVEADALAKSRDDSATAEAKSAVAAPMTGLGAFEPIHAGETLSITILNLANPDDEKITEVVVGDDGSIKLPVVDSMVVWGMTESQLEMNVVKKYRDTTGGRASVAVKRVHVLPATLPAGEAARNESAVEALAAKPATQPTAAPTTAPAEEETLNVVIVVQKNGAPADGVSAAESSQPSRLAQPPATQPATQPGIPVTP